MAHARRFLRIIGGLVLVCSFGLLLGEEAAVLAIPSKLILQLLGALAPLILAAIVHALMTAQFERRQRPTARPAPHFKHARRHRRRPPRAPRSSCAPATGPTCRPAPPSGGLHGADGKPGMLAQFLENVPRSLLGPLTDHGKVIGVIFIAIGFGMAFRKWATGP